MYGNIFEIARKPNYELFPLYADNNRYNIYTYIYIYREKKLKCLYYISLP